MNLVNRFFSQAKRFVDIPFVGVKGNQVRIGVNAPRDVSVHREEIYERIKTEDDAPSNSKPN